MGENRGTIEEVYEPFLIRIGLLERTSNGRIVTQKAKEHINLENEEEKLL
ncbi:MAG: Holliday junction DNA helicase RuvB C-terminal domain-containing protein [Candidatus Magasanikbacteria bacterium]